MNPKGFFKVDRTVMESGVAETDELLGLYIRLKSIANFRPAWFKGQRIEPGEMILSDRNMIERLYPHSKSQPSLNTIKKRLIALANVGAIEITVVKGRSGGRLVTLTGDYLDIENAPKFGANINANVGACAGADRRKPRMTNNGRCGNETAKPIWSQEDGELAELIYTKVLEVLPKTKSPNLENWANTIRLMREQDRRSIDEIRSVFLWANSDRRQRGDFCWAINVRSPAKLRKHYATLHGRMELSNQQDNCDVLSQNVVKGPGPKPFGRPVVGVAS